MIGDDIRDMLEADPDTAFAIKPSTDADLNVMHVRGLKDLGGGRWEWTSNRTAVSRGFAWVTPICPGKILSRDLMTVGDAQLARAKCIEENKARYERGRRVGELAVRLQRLGVRCKAMGSRIVTDDIEALGHLLDDIDWKKS